MKKFYLVFQIALISLLVVMSTTAAGLACHPLRRPFSAEVQASGQPIDPGRSWIDDKGIIHMPYECSTMSIFEQYSANVPLFFPSKSFLKELV
ncbi:hypothetical protein MUP79_04735, partial [Candidatus Bathyarchaeota archaeon]|nr:hypothetical protein [Candidatus Bathyarchaeota archaeon]